MGRHPLTRDILTNIEVVHAPHLLCSTLVGGHMLRVDGELCFLNWSDVSYKTWWQMCGTWYVPKFLLSEGSLTHMFSATFMFQVTPCNSLLTMVKQSELTGCLVE